jgi:hypothetical protein
MCLLSALPSAWTALQSESTTPLYTTFQAVMVNLEAASSKALIFSARSTAKGCLGAAEASFLHIIFLPSHTRLLIVPTLQSLFWSNILSASLRTRSPGKKERERHRQKPQFEPESPQVSLAPFSRAIVCATRQKGCWTKIGPFCLVAHTIAREKGARET